MASIYYNYSPTVEEIYTVGELVCVGCNPTLCLCLCVGGGVCVCLCVGGGVCVHVCRWYVCVGCACV